MAQTPKRRRHRDPERDAQRTLRRLELLEAADRVVRRNGPLTSMDDIASEAGITKPILYKHFGDKGGLYRALAERYVQALMDELKQALISQSDPRARIATTIDAYLSFVEREHEAYAFLMHRAVGDRAEAQATVAEFIRRLAMEIAVVLGEELRATGLDSGAAEPWAHGMVGMVHLAGDWWFEHRSMARTALVEYLTALLWSGFSQLPGTEVPGRSDANGFLPAP